MTDGENRYDGEIDWEAEILSADLATLRKTHGNRSEQPERTPSQTQVGNALTELDWNKRKWELRGDYWR